MYSIIMAGGEGGRLWPLSTPEIPKALMKIFEGKTLLELTIERLLKVSSPGNIFIVITKKLEKSVKKLLKTFPPDNIIVEPVGRNTAPCVTLAARKIYDLDHNAVLGVFPSDHIIYDHEYFQNCIRQGREMASQFDSLVLLGMVPNVPATGYGYIQFKEKIDVDSSFECFKGVGFIEKPDLGSAKNMLYKQNVLWNSGIYIGKAKKFLEETKHHIADVYESINKFYNDSVKLEHEYRKFSSLSFDHAVSEKLNDFIVISVNMKRIDVGNLNAFYEIWERDQNGNAVNGDYVGIESRNNIISSKKPVVLLGVSDMVIVDTPEMIMICPRNNTFDIDNLREKWKKARSGAN